MANHKSAKKRLKQSIVRNMRNSSTKSACRTAIKKTRIAVERGEKEVAVDLYKKAQKIIMTAASKGIFPPGNARRKVSRLAKLVNQSAVA
jgi:small subunit ribosomal protein S20